MEINRVSDILDHQLKNCPLQKAFTGKKADNSNYSFSTQTLKELVDRFSSGLLNRGLKKGDKITLIANGNMPEWNIADLGMLQIGVVNVSVYPNISADDYVYIFRNAGTRCCIVGSGYLLHKVLKAQPSVPSLEKIFTFYDPGTEADCNGNKIENWNVLINNEADYDKIRTVSNDVKADDLATIIYTSGTTGMPKGVMLSHRNITNNVKSISEVMLLDKGDRALSYLPVCHGFERTFVYCYMFKGLEVYYAQSPQSLGHNIREVNPHIITAVPGVLEKVYGKILHSAERKGYAARKIFHWAVNLSQKFSFNADHGLLYRLKMRIADKLVFSGIRKALGGSLKLIGVGASACPERLLKFFCAAGIPVREGYGLTETSAVLSVNQIPEERAMLGTVGMVLRGFEVKIAEEPEVFENGEGEILVRGVSVFKGYYNDTQATAEAFNEEGWFKTGDIGKFVVSREGQKFIKLTDRKKELLKSSNGKYLAPVAIENRLKESNFVSQAMAVGEQRKFVAALIIPEFDVLDEWCRKSGIDIQFENGLIISPEVKEKFAKIVNEANTHLSKYEQVRKFLLLSQSWGVDTGELTPTMKMKRKVIEKKFSELINRMFENDRTERKVLIT